MPLPDGAPLSLQVQSNLGNAVQSKPKRAMIVRMSAETLEALEAFPNHPQMSLDFGDNPGIFIGETFFPMRPQKEGSPHELYLRAASAAKPMAPLKLYANVIGKFIVERQLGEKVEEKVRQQTQAAKQQHMERQTITLDQPLIPATGGKNGKRKMPGSGTVVKKAVGSNQLQVPSSSTVAARKVSPLPQNPPSSKANADVRRRLVHCLAISPRLAEDAVKMVGGANCSTQARDDLLALLEEIAEQQAPAKKGDKSPRPWTLKPQTWTEVRPYEWPKLTEAERTTMSRQARMAFKALKIPETDPAWGHVRYRQTGPTIPQPASTAPPLATSSSNRSSSSAQAEAKRPAISSKDSKSKPKQDSSRSKGEIQMKDESAKATVSRVNAIKQAERPSTPSDAGGGGKPAASRRLPGSGYQVKKSPQPTPAPGSAEKPAAPKGSVPASLPPKPATAPPPAGGSYGRKTIPTVPPKPTKKEEEEEDKERDKEYGRLREREREYREKEKELERQRIEWEREKEKVEMEKREAEKREKARLREREREREEMRKEKEREELEKQERRLMEREKERLAKEKERATSNAIKRKMVPSGDASPDPTKAPIPKRRKLDDAASTATASSSASKARDPGLPKKPVHEPSPVPRLKMKKEPSPLPPPRASSSSTTKPERTKTNSTTKLRRKSPIYTSSEDEGEIPQPRKRNPSPPPVSDRSASDQSIEKQPPTRYRPRASYPTSHDGLRDLYHTQYPEYAMSFAQMMAQKSKIDAVLKGDKDAEAELMDPDELHNLAMDHQSMRGELEHIIDLLNTKTTSSGARSSE